MQVVKCRIIDKALRERFDEYMNLDLDKAHRLKNAGKIEIVDEEVLSKNLVATQYKTKIQKPQTNYEIKSLFTTDKKKYKIAWVQDNSKPTGGAEISNRGVISVGEQVGLDIAVVTPQVFSEHLLKDCDMMVLNNIFEFSNEQFKIILDYCFEKSKPYVKYDHDQREAKRSSSLQIFLRSKCNIFISPAHRDFIMKGLHLPEDAKNVCLPLCINVNQFILKDGTREKDTALVPSPYKCTCNLATYVEQNKHLKFTLIRSRPTPQFDGFSNVKYTDPVDQDGMVQLYNSHEYMVHLPDSFWAGERVYFEALLCGCKPIINTNVGHASWPSEETNNLKVHLTRAPFTFWRKIKELL